MKKRQKKIHDCWWWNIQKLFYFFACIFPYNVADEIIKQLWKNSHFAWEMVSFWGGKTHFGKTPLKLCIFRQDFCFCFYQYGSLIVIVPTKWSLYSIYMIFWPFSRTITYPKNNFCFHESIFQWQIKLRRKSKFMNVLTLVIMDFLLYLFQ